MSSKETPLGNISQNKLDNDTPIQVRFWSCTLDEESRKYVAVLHMMCEQILHK